MKWTPRNYQLTAISFLLSHAKSGLFLDPGLGKTAISLATIKTLINSESIKGVLLVAPLRVVYSTWPNEINKWDNFKTLSQTILHGKTKPTLWGEQKDIYLINPEGLPWLFKELSTQLNDGKKCPFDMLLIDESTKFKNPKASIKKTKSPTRFGYIKNMLPLFKRRVIMTGTPASKSLIDLWSQVFILDEGASLSANFYRFKNKHFYTESWNEYNWILKDGAADLIHKAIAPLVLEMASEDYLDMPDLLFNYIEIDLPAKALKQYKEMESKLFTLLDEEDSISADATAQASQKCHQMANGKVYEDIPDNLDKHQLRQFRKTRKTFHIHSEKTSALEDLIDELNGKPLIIAYHYKHDLEAILSVCGKDTPYIGQGVTPQESKRIEKEWNAGNIPILIGHPDSMAHGLNLQESGNDICWFSLPFSLENYIQFNKRIHRSGVVGTVRIHHLVANNTLDLAILERLGERAEQQVDLRKALKKYRQQLNKKRSNKN